MIINEEFVKTALWVNKNNIFLAWLGDKTNDILAS